MATISCPKCNAKYSIDTSKVPSSGSAVKCKKCQTVIQLTPDMFASNPPSEGPKPCPKCGFAKGNDNEVCPQCGIIFDKYKTSDNKNDQKDTKELSAKNDKTDQTKTENQPKNISTSEEESISVIAILAGILIIIMGVVSLVMFWEAARQFSGSGADLTSLRSVGGETVAEAYYQEIGRYGIALSRLSKAFGVVSLGLCSGIGCLLIKRA